MGTMVGLTSVYGDEMLAKINGATQRILREAYRQRLALGDHPRNGYAVRLAPVGCYSSTAIQMLIDRKLLSYAPGQDFSDPGQRGAEYFISEEAMALGKALEEV
jgi:hypothetical protein